MRWMDAGGSQWRIVAVLLAIGLPWLAGCFTYVPTNPETVAPEQEVRATLHPEAARRVAEDPARIPGHLKGRIVGLTADSVRLAVPVAGREHRGTAFEDARRIHLLARPDVLEFQQRELNRNRTIIAGLAIGAGVGLLAALVFDLGGGGGSPGDALPPNGSQPAVLPR